MPAKTPPKRGPGRPATGRTTVSMPLRVTPEARRELRMAAADAGCTYGEIIEKLLVEHNKRVARQRAAQPSPLHRPRNLEQL